MATGEGDSMAPDEMYLMLQADMVCTILQSSLISQIIQTSKGNKTMPDDNCVSSTNLSINILI